MRRKKVDCDCEADMRKFAKEVADQIEGWGDLKFFIMIAQECPMRHGRSTVVSLSNMEDDEAKSAIDNVMHPEAEIVPEGVSKH